MNIEKQKKKILIVMPRFPYPVTGACEQDRAEGLNIFLDLGCEIRVIAKVSPNEEGQTQEVSKKLGIKIFPISYKFTRNLSFSKRFLKNLKRMINPLFWDGASYEYRDKEIVNVFEKELDEFKPDVVWFEYTTLWPLYKYARNKNIPIITRSHNFEALHFLEEEGYGPINLLRFFSKFLGEVITARKSDFLLAITPKEELLYKKIGAKKTDVLPLRRLPTFLSKEKIVLEKEKLNVFFTGSTYNVPHNMKALKKIVFDIAPKVNKLYPGSFSFHILGAKLPQQMKKIFGGNIIYQGFVENLDQFLNDMDIALVPSLFGAGMQQKVFEPMARGIPTIASSRSMAGYPFENNKHILLVDNTDDFISALNRMREYNLRKSIASEAKKLSREIFSEDKIKSVVSKSLNHVFK
ncbi:glycosyltransferase family 4 protein [Candidatus Woesearchaeota archaeon]|jgi:glycosyltransferase involved in cell wall biosynthesis|nr:glycosyltransferase family 4 protein [Candidatus Woesearchaeota archaeon]MBT4733078.1 glycosyltransferase family 4 protein [Candidatus Woesearchaeota archaeon]